MGSLDMNRVVEREVNSFDVTGKTRALVFRCAADTDDHIRRFSFRRENLSWKHHSVIAPLSTRDQKKWLNRAEKEKLIGVSTDIKF